MKHFKAPAQTLGKLDAESAAALIAAAADVTLVMDRKGIIRDMAVNGDALSSDLSENGSWVGRPWVDTVTTESRPKIEALLKDAAAGQAGRSRQINHPSTQTVDVPVLYSAVQAGQEGRIVAFGRNLQQVSTMQRRLVEAQQSMQQDYSRLRHVESRYRLLFSGSSEPVLIVNASTRKVQEANPAAAALFGETIGAVTERTLTDAFEPAAAGPLGNLLAVVQAAGHADDLRLRLRNGTEVHVSASLLRQENGPLFLVRLSRVDAAAAQAPIPPMALKILKLVERAPDGFVVTDTDGRILSANTSFLDMAQIGTDRQALEERLDRWLGRPGVDLEVLIDNLRQRGAVRLFASTLHGEFGSDMAVEISAAAVMNDESPCCGFAIRDIGRRLKIDIRRGPELPRSVAHLTELVGRVSLKELVREATDVIERLSIEAALQMTGDNRASAAEMLGVSRQSLYVKLRRYGIADLSGENGTESA